MLWQRGTHSSTTRELNVAFHARSVQLTKHNFSLIVYHLMVLKDAGTGTEHDVGQRWNRKDRCLAKEERKLF